MAKAVILNLLNRVLIGTARLFILYSVQTGSGAHTAPYLMGTEGSFSGVKAAEA
jgi:hypothetical protein